MTLRLNNDNGNSASIDYVDGVSTDSTITIPEGDGTLVTNDFTGDVEINGDVSIGGGDIELNADGSASLADGNFTVSSDGVLDLQAVDASADASTLIRAGSANTTAGNQAFLLRADGQAEFANTVSAGGSVVSRQQDDRAHYWHRNTDGTKSFVTYVDFSTNKAAVLEPQPTGSLEEIKLCSPRVINDEGILVESTFGDGEISRIKDVDSGNYLEITSYRAKGIAYTISRSAAAPASYCPCTVSVSDIIDNLDFNSNGDVDLDLSAGQLQTLAPKLIGEFSDGSLFLKTEQTLVYTLKALKEANEKIADLTTRLAALEGGAS